MNAFFGLKYFRVLYLERMGDLAEHIKAVVVGIRDNDNEYLKASIIQLLSQDDMRDLINKDTSRSGSGSTASEWIEILICILNERKEKEYLSYFNR